MSVSNDQNLECPLCMEPFEMDDFTFFPCTCGYQICRFCWHRIRTDENGLCPACRKQYPEDPADFKPLSVEEFQKIRNEKRQKDQQRKHKVSESRRHLSDVRVVQKNLVFVVGLPTRLADSELLKKNDYFGKFGRIHKVVVNQSTSYAGSQGPSASAYVTYYKSEDALRAIKNVDHIQIDGRTLKASLGTTKYCSHFLRNQQCPKTDCMYLHELGDEAASFTKEDMRQGKHQDYERKLQDQYQISINKKEAVSRSTQNKPHSYKETWPSAPQNTKAVRTKESKTDKQYRSKSKYTSSEIQKSKKIKGKPDDPSLSNVSSTRSSNNREEVSGLKRSSRPQKFSKDCINSIPSPLQRTEAPSRFRNIISTDKQSAVNEMNNKNVQKTLFHIEGQPVSNQSMKTTNKTKGDSPSFPSSPTSSSSSSLVTPFGSLSSNFLSLSPSPPPHSADLTSFGAEESSLHEESGNYSTSNSPQNVIDTATVRPQSVTFSSSQNATLCSQLNKLSVAPDCGSYSGPMSEDVPHTAELETNPNYVGCSSASQTQQQDDDLDFDPWDESNKGLADLIAKEETVHTSPTTSIPPGFSRLVQSNVPNQRTIPPPGFICTVFKGSLDTAKRITPWPSTIENRKVLQAIPKPFNSQKPTPVHNSQSKMGELLRTKDLQDGFRALFPNINVTFSSCGLQKSFSQNVLPLNPPLDNPCVDGSWLPHERAAILPEFVSGIIWKKKLEQVEDDSNRFLNSSYSSPFVFRGPWPSSSQCPPPGFVAPSRSPANTPYEHVQVNQSELKSEDDSID